MDEFEDKISQATKIDELFTALSSVSFSKEIVIINLQAIGTRFRKSVCFGSVTSQPILNQIPDSFFMDFVTSRLDSLEYVMCNQTTWVIHKLPTYSKDIQLLCLPKDDVPIGHIKRFAHEWGWHKRLANAEEMLLIDELTGLYNMRYLDRAIDHELLRSQRFNVPFSLLFIDLDNFKKVNDVHGHLAGSELLKAVGSAIKDAVREVDSVIRYGGDEFVAMLIGANASMAMIVAERVRAFISSTTIKVDTSLVSVTASIGIASYPTHGTTRNSLLAAADSSMYSIKNNGKNAVGRPKLEALNKGVPSEQKYEI